MKLYPVSKKLRKYAYAHGFKDIKYSLLLHYADEVKLLEERLVKSEIELAWRNAFDTEERMKHLALQVYNEKQKVFSWQQTFKCDAPWEAELKHKAEIAILSAKLERAQRLLVMMMPSVIRDDMMKSFDIKKTEFWHRSKL